MTIFAFDEIVYISWRFLKIFDDFLIAKYMSFLHVHF